MEKKELKIQLLHLKSDYMRIQEDMDKLEFVGGRVSSAEGQLIRLEQEIKEINDRLAKLD